MNNTAFSTVYVWLSTGMLFLLSTGVFAQQPCGPAQSKKAIKLRDKAQNARGISLADRIALLGDALDVEPECAECRFLKARAEYQYASERSGNYARAYTDFETLVEDCPDYAADAFYYAGIIAYGNQDYEAAKRMFEGFLAYTGDNKPRDYAEKSKDVNQVLPETRFYVDFYENPVPYNPQRLDGINSTADEYLPMLSPDNSVIYFTRKSKQKAKGDIYSREVERFMKAGADSEGKYKNPEPLPPPFNVGDNYGGVSLSLNNREMFVTVCKTTSSNYKNCDLYVTEYSRKTLPSGEVKYAWSGLKNLGDAVNTEGGWEAQPTLSADGNTLYFATVRAGTTPDKDGNPTTDIYLTRRGDDGLWSPAKPVAGSINSAGNDKSPFLHTDSRTLYFASDGRPGAGGYDIYFSKQDDSGQWSEPQNIGYPINSPQDEHGLVVSTDGKRAFFASSNIAAAQGLDVFSFSMPEKAKPEKVLIVKGAVKDRDGHLIPDARIELKYTESKQVEEVEVNRHDGSYSAVLNLYQNEDIVMSVKSDSSAVAFNTRVFSPEDTATAVKELPLEIAKLEKGKSYRMNDIRFATASSNIDGASKKVLDEFAEYMAENPRLRVLIQGHTDNVGDAETNLALSKDRAFEVFGYLQKTGVDPARMAFEGYGQTRPLVPNDSPENRAKNRRTEFKITQM